MQISEGRSVAHQPLLVSSSRVIALSCGIKISAVNHSDLSQSTRVTDRQTDRITTPKTALAYARAVKTHSTLADALLRVSIRL